MSIEIKYNSEFEYVFENAYAKIEDVKLSIEKNECWVDIRIYADENARKAKEIKNVNGIGKITVKYNIADLEIKSFDINEIKNACYLKLKAEHVLFKNGKDV